MLVLLPPGLNHGGGLSHIGILGSFGFSVGKHFVHQPQFDPNCFGRREANLLLMVYASPIFSSDILLGTNVFTTCKDGP